MEVQNGKSVVLNEAKVVVLGQDDFKNYLVELDMMRSGPNENNWDFQNVAEYAQTFVNQPILIAYPYDGKQIGAGHLHTEKIDPETGEIYWSFIDGMAERPTGYISAVRTETREDGYEWLVAKGVIWRFYSRELVDKLQRTGRMSVSVETNILQGYDRDGIEVFTAWDGLGVTILGDGVAPAVPGANIHALAALQQEYKRLQLKAASRDPLPDEGAQSRKKSEKKGVKQSMNKALIEHLQSRFGDAYKVMSASEDGSKVCLLGKDNVSAYTYAFEESDKGEVIADRIKPISLSASFRFGEDEVIDVPVDALVRELTVALSAAETERDALRTEKDNLATMLSSMQDKEKDRRKADAKSAAKARLAEINANRAEDEQVPEVAINSVLEAADNGEFDACENASAEAITRVNSLCMTEIEKIDKAKAAKIREMNEQRWGFEGSLVEKPDSDGLKAMFDRVAAKD